MFDDVKAAWRSLRGAPTFTAVALLVLALGIGASTAIFSVVDAVVLRALPFDEHDRLVAVGERRAPNPDFPTPPGRDPDALVSAAPQNYKDWAERQTVFESMAAIGGISLALRQPDGPAEELRGQRVTAGFFDVLRVYPRLGRAFTVENETEGRHFVAVLSDGLWRTRFGADPDIVGKTLPIDGGAYEVVGVMPPGFEYPVGSVRSAEVWVPYMVPPDDRVRDPNNRNYYLQSIARLAPGVSVEQAQANMNQIAAALEAEHPAWNKGSLVGVRPLHDHIVGSRTRQWMLMLIGAVAIVLLIACANVANLLLARASVRGREIGIRAALGAGRWQLVRQLLVESLVLSVLATVLGVLLAGWAIGVLKAAMPEGVPRVTTIALDLRVLGAAAALSLITGLLFGLVPALQLSRPDLTSALKDGSRGAGTGGGRQRLRGALVVAEVALAVVLLVGAALFLDSFRALMRIDPGFQTGNLLTLSIVPRLDRGISTGNALPNYGPQLQEIVDRVQLIPGVQHAAVITGGMPLGGSMSTTSIRIAGRELTGPDSSISVRRVTPDYHHTMGIPLKEGRLLEPADRAGAAPVVVLNEAAARKYFPGESAVGKSVNINSAERTVVGVVGDVYQSSLEMEPRTEVYLPLAQQSAVFSELIVRTSGDPYDAVQAVKSAAVGVMPDALVRNIRTMDEIIARATAQRRLNMLLLGLFGILALVIAAVGIYGVMAYVVAQRTREIGVRMALGATRAGVVSMVMRSALLLVGVGLAAGGVAAWFVSTAADSFLFRVEARDPRAFATALAVLAAAAGVASLVPARRAASVDPMVALRAE